MKICDIEKISMSLVILFFIILVSICYYRYETSSEKKLEKEIYEQRLKNELLYLKNLEKELKEKSEGNNGK